MEIEPNPARGEGYILVVDDVPAMAELIAGWLQKSGYNTKIACDYAQAKKRANKSEPRIIIVDDNIKDSPISYDEFLPGFDSGIARNIGWIYPNTEVILFTENRKKYHVGWWDGYPGPRGIYMEKPFNPKELMYFINKLTTDRGEPTGRYRI